MKTYQIEPMAPLVFRSGRPFGEGSRDGANFPWPSSLAGLLRTVAMDEADWLATKLSDEQHHALMAMPAAGPILARRENSIITPLLPKPADALYLLKDEKIALFHLAPGAYPAGSGSDLPDDLAPVVLEAGAPKSKPQKGAEFWPLNTVLAWRRGEQVEYSDLPKETDKPLADTRSSVAINRKFFASATGKLFQIQGLDFSHARQAKGGFDAHDWLLLARFSKTLMTQGVTLGGERRLSWLTQTEADPLLLPAEHAAALAQSKGVAITFATPALFAGGWKPGWLNAGLEGDVPGIPGLRLRLKAAAIERWQGLSGWDLKTQKPKLARKAVAAGATYWFEIAGTPPAGWEESLWLAPLSDHPQDRLDGFGLAIPGPWNTSLNAQ
jgi:CRISPR-associated protein Cmr3